MQKLMQRFAKAGRSSPLWVWVFLTSALVTAEAAVARPNCNVPNPPPACDGSTPTPPPAPAQNLQRPLIGGFGDFYGYRIYVDVQAQRADLPRVASMTVQTGPTLDGPWVNWKVRQSYTSLQIAGRSVLDYTDPSPTRCFRSQIFAANGDYSPWSIAKCIRPVALATNVQLSFNSSGATIRWKDNSSFDDSYVIYYRLASSSQSYMFHPVGDQQVTGMRQVALAGWNPYDRLCVTLWPIEKLPGVDLTAPAGYLSDSTPMNPAIWRTPEVCGDIGF